MLMPPRHAHEAFVRLAPDLQEISDFINTSLLRARERMRLANMLAAYFVGVAREHARPGLRLVLPDAPQAK